MKYIGALDQGTTSTRFIIFDDKNNIVSSSQLEHRQIFPKPGWVEHNPEEIWKNTQKVIERGWTQRRRIKCRRYYKPEGDHNSFR